MNRGIVLAALKRLDEALASYARAIALNPGQAAAYNNRGNTLQALNRPDDALADFDAAIRLDPGFADAFVNRGNTLKALNRWMTHWPAMTWRLPCSPPPRRPGTIAAWC